MDFGLRRLVDGIHHRALKALGPALVAVLVVPPASAQVYDITNLGLGGSGGVGITGINDNGQVAGLSATAAGEFHAFFATQSGGTIDIGTLGGDYSQAAAINASGQVVGFSTNSAGNFRAFSWTQAGGLVDLNTLGGSSSQARYVNDAGTVFGVSQTEGDQATHAFSWTQAGGMVDLTLAGNASGAYAVSASGEVIGWSSTPTGATHAFSWKQGSGIVDLGSLGGTSSVAYGVNNWGQVVGQAALAGNTTYHAFLYEDGQLKDLNDLVRNKPADLELLRAGLVTDGKSIVAWTNAGVVLLSPASTTTAPPVVGQITANDPLPVGVSLSATARFTDAASDTHTAVWTWGDGTPTQPGTVTEAGGSGTAAGSHVFTAAGVYPVTLALTDSTGLTSRVSRNVVVYDASAGFVTGSGWIQSPPGAYKPDVAAAGRATFSFVSKYQKGANGPTGTTEFHFQTANLDFQSDAYDWLVVGGARAQFKGTGSLNGTGGYQFKLTAIDGKISGGSESDRFRIKISRYDADLKQDVVVYDNQIDSSAEGTPSEGTVIGGGSIVIHTPKN